MDYKELICLQQSPSTHNSKKGRCMNGKKIWKILLDEKHLLGKPIPFSIKNTANNPDTWGFI